MTRASSLRRTTGAVAIVLAGLACHAGVTPREITDEVTVALRAALPGGQVERVDDLTLRVAGPGGMSTEVRLDGVYTEARNDPARRAAAVRELVASVVAEQQAASSPIDPTRIVPVVRERAFVEEEAREGRPGDATAASRTLVWEPLGGSLIVAYVEDVANGLHYLDEDELRAAGVERGSLRLLACGNLRRLLPAAIEIEDLDRAFLISAGGSYASSLLLLDELWTRERFPVAGDFIVAVPTRDVLLVTGSEERRGLAKVRRSAGIASRRGDHPFTKSLFRREAGGTLVPFVDPTT